MAESLCEELGKEILNLSEDIAKKKIDKAQYDKSYNAVILGVNQSFVDDVPEKDKSELISKHSIPKTADNGKYYTFKINGVYYVKKSNTDFKLYEDVVVRVPNGNWNNMFIEVQRDTVSISDEPTPTPTPTPPPTSSTAMVSFEKNRLYYNGETYHLQFGANKRIMCVTKGNKYALINSYGYTESRIEAATAVMNGLTEDWDLEFDCDDPEINVQSLLEGNYSGGDERKYENGRVKIRLTGTIPDVAGITFNWFECKREKGNLIHIGGRLSKVNVLCNRYKAEHITFGENIKVIGGVFFNSPSTIENGHEHGIPPFVEYISNFIYSGSGYLYIPESCKNIARDTFAYNSASEIEIEEEGGMLTVGEGAFRKSDYGNAQLTVDVVKIPLRVSSSLYSNFAYLGARAIVFGKGITSLKYERIDYIVGDYFPLIKDIPCYIFIPSSVTYIDSNLIYYEPTKYRNTFIIYEGSQSSWNNITKVENWGGGNSNVTVICDSSAYNNSESFINRFVRRS